jgi:hypothetical protein
VELDLSTLDPQSDIGRILLSCNSSGRYLTSINHLSMSLVDSLHSHLVVTNFVTTSAPEYALQGYVHCLLTNLDATQDASKYQRPQPPGRQLPLPMRRSNDCLAPTYSMRTR